MIVNEIKVAYLLFRNKNSTRQPTPLVQIKFNNFFVLSVLHKFRIIETVDIICNFIILFVL